MATETDPLEGFDKTADPVNVDQAQETKSTWIRDQLHRMAQLRLQAEDVDGERRAIAEELLPVLKEMGRPVMFQNPATGETSLAQPIAAEDWQIDVDKLEELLGPDVVAPYTKRSMTRAQLEALMRVHNLTLLNVHEAVRVQYKAAYVKF